MPHPVGGRKVAGRKRWARDVFAVFPITQWEQCSSAAKKNSASILENRRTSSSSRESHNPVIPLGIVLDEGGKHRDFVAAGFQKVVNPVDSLGN
jgi:hypothetical protein